jgi:hypothetical protein
MKQLTILRFIGIAIFATVLGFTGCKGESTEQENDGEVEIVGDSINPTGSDGLGREIDTVEQIERSQQDTVIATP